MAVSTSQHWKVYKPNADVPWNVQRVVHLHRRAGFAATWEGVRRDLHDGPNPAIDRMLAGETCVTAVPDDFEETSRVIGDAAVAANSPNRLKAWWIHRMIFSPDPLTERLTLLWHNHFATSNLKIDDVGAMRRQNEIFRHCARKPFGELLSRAVKDPAMLLWLDADSNRKEHPNENLARELMELFSIGVGNFSETDVKEVARALTGWTTQDGRFRPVDEYHDDGEKTVLGTTGHLDGDGVLELVRKHPATAKRIAWRLCDYFFGEDAATAEMVEALAEGLRLRDLDVGWAVETILHSDAFFSEKNIGNRVLAPVDYVVGAVRAFEMFDPPPSTLVLAEWTARLGQDLFYPPNVFGWRGGREWITSRSMISRANFSMALVHGTVRNPQTPVDGLALAQRHTGTEKLDEVTNFFWTLLTGRTACRERIGRTLDELPTKRGFDAATLQHVLVSLMSSPESQLG